MAEKADKGERGVEIVTLCTLCFYVQQYYGIPVSSFFLKKAGKELLKNDMELKKYYMKNDTPLADISHAPLSKRQNLLPASELLSRPSVILFKLALITALSTFIADFIHVSYLVVTLVMGFVFTELGFLEKNIMQKSDSQGIITILVSCVILQNLVNLTPSQLLGYIFPVSVIMIVGLIGTTIGGYLVSKIIKINPNLGIGLAMACTYGFPNTLIIANDLSEVLGRNETEKLALLNFFRPKLLVAGFITCTITSVFVAAAVVNYIL